MSRYNSAGYGTPNASRYYFSVSLLPQTGSLQVNLTHAGAVSAGAQ